MAGKRTLLALSASLVIGIVLNSASGATSISDGVSVGQWVVKPVYDTEGQFGFCDARSEQDNGQKGVSLSLSVSKSGSANYFLRLASEEWLLVTDSQMSATLQIDGKNYGSRPVQASTTNILMFALGFDPVVIGAIERGSLLAVTLASGSTQFVLNDSAAVLASLRKCAAAEFLAMAAPDAQKRPPPVSTVP